MNVFDGRISRWIVADRLAPNRARITFSRMVHPMGSRRFAIPVDLFGRSCCSCHRVLIGLQLGRIGRIKVRDLVALLLGKPHSSLLVDGDAAGTAV
jgi:hypothetical protein